jgi:hypothetical protein
MLRILLAGFAGAVAMFVWTSIAHMATPLGQIGIQAVANDDVVTPLQTATGDKPGLFFFPSVNMADPNDMAAYDKKTQAMASGIVIYHPAGQGIGMSATTLVAEFVKELALCLIAAFLLTLTALVSYAARVGFLALVGLSGVLTTNVSYLIWYGYPLDYTLAYMTIEFVGALAAALAIAAIVRPRTA